MGPSCLTKSCQDDLKRLSLADGNRAQAKGRTPFDTSAINAGQFSKQNVSAKSKLLASPGFWRFVKFCFVGGGGVVVDMAMLHLLADSTYFAMPYQWAKLCAAETALINNFVWNELWTFKDAAAQRRFASVLPRFLKFHVICGTGILWAVGLLWLFHGKLKLNLYLANLMAIGLVTLWNYWLNARFNWRIGSLKANKKN